MKGTLGQLGQAVASTGKIVSTDGWNSDQGRRPVPSSFIDCAGKALGAAALRV